ncbi:MAG: TonB-dependent receptor [Bacteroidales bacterium]|jgi:iron complex outermembrane receptor protein|nr:TonB-dependent receptor [Bacteroidales bacterium]
MWSRKRYAVFNSLRRVIRIFTLCTAYSILVAPGFISARNIGSSTGTVASDPDKNTATTDPDDTLKIQHFLADGVIVTASRTPIEAQKANRIVTVISKSDIARAPAQNLNDLLRSIPGVDIRQRGPLGTQADISIRGGTFDQTLILLNGINVTDPQTGHHNLSLPVDIESIERIEILNGPAAKSFGPNAFSGVVNIITGNSNPNSIRASLLLGQYGLSRISANISNTSGKLEQFLSLSRMASEGYIENTDFSNSSFFYQAKYQLKSGIIDLQTGYGARNFGANSFYSLKYPDQFESVKTDFVSIKYQNRSAIRIVPVIYVRRNRDRFELKRDDESVPFNHHRTLTAGLNLNIWMVHRFGRTSLGADLRNENILSNVLGNLLSSPVQVRGYENTYYLKSYNRFNTSIYAEQTISVRKFTGTAGVMAYHNPDLSFFGFYPGMDLSYRFNDRLRIYSSVNKTLRMPSFTDMFYTSPVQQGNPQLKPEEAVTWEAGIKYSSTFLKGDISAFRRRGNNLIDWVKDPSADSLIWRSANHADISFAGIEASLSLTPETENHNGRFQSLRVSSSFLKADPVEGDMLSRYALDYLRHQVNISVDFRIVARLYNSTTVTWRNRSGAWQDVTGEVVSYEPFWLSDTRFTWKEQHISVYIEASNVFNSRYYDFGGLIQPGTWIRGGILLNINYLGKRSGATE